MDVIQNQDAELDRLRAELAALRDVSVRLEQERDELRARVAALEEGLKPFARGHLYFDEEFRQRTDTERAMMKLNQYDHDDRSPTAGDCRAAAALLAPASGDVPRLTDAENKKLTELYEESVRERELDGGRWPEQSGDEGK